MSKIIPALIFYLASVSYVLSQHEISKVSYDLYKQVFYSYEPGKDIKTIPTNELVYHKPFIVKEHHSLFLDNQGGVIHQIDHFVDTEYPSWMEMPTKTIISDFGVYKYNRLGQEIVSLKYDGVISNKLIKSKIYDVPDFNDFELNFEVKKFISDNNMSALFERFIHNKDFARVDFTNGYIFIDSNNSLHIKNANNELVLNVENLYISKIYYDENNNEDYRVENTYKINLENNLIPNEAVEVYKNKTSNNINYDKIEFVSYSNYKMFKNELIDPIKEPNINLYPNPVIDELNIKLSSSKFLNSDKLNIEITDVEGKIILNKQLINVSDFVKLNVDHLESGIYLIQLTNDVSIEKIRFIKK